ncbi:type IV secretory system conjugative DNA transfer family protein [Williamsia sterculiae]|uniref:TraM recognition site of TraD and TraG n=1 Tax=Williamsia sterculiae TaxID=1344003 RepID=A0A1N7HEA0_9NOCA|nr:TraM recognition domain-containing protein [Williamsia sterculiae]SIS23207.1 TraM recognition site of TraD and TraG [Williamsia sterculiae]
MAATRPGKIANPSNSEVGLYAGLAAIGIGIVAVLWLALHLAGGQTVPGNPIALLILTARGKVVWGVAATVWAIVLLALIAAPIVAGWRWWTTHRVPKARVDTAARHLGSGADIEGITEESVRDKAAKLKVVMPDPAVQPYCSPGTPIGVTVGGSVLNRSTGRTYASWEDVCLDIWGPRMGKSTSRIIPAICEAPGAVLATENKRGNLDHTRLLREFRDANGVATRQVWVFDPQQVANETAWFYWNPLSYIIADTDNPGGLRYPAVMSLGGADDHIDPDDDILADDPPTGKELVTLGNAPVPVVSSDPEERSASLAEQFAAGEGGDAARRDPYFDPEGEDLLANLLLASALAGEQIIEVYKRLARRERCKDAVQILTDHGYDSIAEGLAAKLRLAGKQQDGIFGTALKMARCLRTKRVAQWITTFDGDTRPQLDVHGLLTGGETLYCLSREGVGSVGPIIAALTVATCEAAEQIATASPGGRLPTPLLCALDEAANTVRWRRLPDLYSHYGSRGIHIMTVLQSWSQGVRVWGEDGMKQLMGAANVFVYGGNNKENGFLESLAKLCGDYDREVVSVTKTRDSHTTSRHISREPIFTASDLTAWPRGRALVFSAGNRPTIVKTVPWMDKPYSHLIEASLTEYGEATTRIGRVMSKAIGRGGTTPAQADATDTEPDDVDTAA